MSHVFSASQINTFAQEPAIWVIQSLFKMRSPQNQWAIRGEVFGRFLERAAVSQDFDNLPSVEMIKNEIGNACLAANLDCPSLSSLENDWKVAIDHFKRHKEKGFDAPLPPPKNKNNQHEFLFDAKHGKVRGYFDLKYPMAVMDIKYRSEIPMTSEEEKKNRNSDMIQLACYWKATGHRQFLLEICKGKVKQSAYGQEDLEFYWKVAEHNMGCMRNIYRKWLNSGAKASENKWSERERMHYMLCDLPIHNPRLYWWPEAEELILEAIS